MGTGATGITTLYDILYNPGTIANLSRSMSPLCFRHSCRPALHFRAIVTAHFETGAITLSPPSSGDRDAQRKLRRCHIKLSYLQQSAGRHSYRAQGDFSLEFWHSLPLECRPVITHLLTPPTSTPSVYLSTSTLSSMRNKIRSSMSDHNSVMTRRHAARHFIQLAALRFELCAALYHAVQRRWIPGRAGRHFNFTRDFSIAMTFACPM